VTIRAVFYEEDDAGAVAAQLTSDGFDARVVRDRLAGEDDDEDHPWAVITDAPEFILEVLVEQYDGWLDAEPGHAPESATLRQPLDLPEAPKRIKNHFPRD
jgi:hypothetical protein